MGSCFGPAIGFIGGALQLTLWVEGDASKPDGIDRVETVHYLSLIQVRSNKGQLVVNPFKLLCDIISFMSKHVLTV